MNKEDFISFAQHLADQPVNYKYYNATTAIRALQEDSLQFSHPSIFNDPFDVNVNLFNFDKEEVEKYLGDKIKKKHSTNYIERFRLNRNLKTKILPEHTRVMQEIFEAENSNRGITCFSKNNNNLLMWAHYGITNTGICIGYDLCELRDFIYNHNPESCLLEVDYIDKITPQKDFRTMDIMSWFKTKHQVWNYEDEIRLISRPLSFYNKRNYFNIPKSIIKEVYLGYSISPKDKETVITLLKKEFRHVKLFQIMPDFKSFSLERKETIF